MTATLDVFYFPGSTYTYLAALRAPTLAAASGVELRWRPFNVRAIMIEMDNVPFAKKPIKARYMWRDIERRAQRHGLPWSGQPPYPVDPELKALRIATVASLEGFGQAFAEASYRAWFLEGKIPGVDQNTEAVLHGLDKDPEQVVALANSGEILQQVEAETDAARSLGIFGSPTFVVGQEIFWGDDRLEDALDWLATEGR
ncbi:2-hydroxychromene-2-carboxylate isomerase [Devosia naphthalenivorans]|uniref:2-hydroxychromene-2-carboxylate isomerase n=1 Tax=Devosia naphthalenivorans TaxID=2082392 RepID=UPI000D3C14D3|nr:2-hydroxychromene-2-carboxylate isomerase [Devosia naphthalenivorans]